jgi:hypothetical protein
MKRVLTRYAVNLVLAVTSMLVMLVLTEIVLRFTSYKNLLPAVQIEPLRNYLKVDQVKGYDIRENAPLSSAFVDGLKYSIWSNELGCFDMPYTGEKDFTLLVGDSFTFGFAPFNDKWGTKAENLLGQRILKCGVGGYGTKQELLKAADVISRTKRSPKLIIVGYFLNDLEDDYLFPNATIIDGYPVVTRDIKDMETGKIVDKEKAALEEDKAFGVKEYPHNFLLKNLKWRAERQSIVYHMVKYSARSMLLKVPFVKDILVKTKAITPFTLAFSDKPWVDRAWSVHFSNLRTFKALADRHGSRLLVVIIPYREQVYPFLTSWEGMDREKPQNMLRDFFNKEGIDHLDVLPLFKKRARQTRHVLNRDQDLYWGNDPHLNIKGNDLLSLLVSQYILQKDLLVVSDKDKKLSDLQRKLDAFN